MIVSKLKSDNVILLYQISYCSSKALSSLTSEFSFILISYKKVVSLSFLNAHTHTHTNTHPHILTHPHTHPHPHEHTHTHSSHTHRCFLIPFTRSAPSARSFIFCKDSFSQLFPSLSYDFVFFSFVFEEGGITRSKLALGWNFYWGNYSLYAAVRSNTEILCALYSWFPKCNILQIIYVQYHNQDINSDKPNDLISISLVSLVLICVLFNNKQFYSMCRSVIHHR